MKKKLADRSLLPFLIVLALLIAGVEAHTEEQKQIKSFNEIGWKEYSDRVAMAHDLLKTERLKGLSKADVHALLGVPYWDYNTYELYALKHLPNDSHIPKPVVPALKIQYIHGSDNLVSLTTCVVPADRAYPDFIPDE